MTVDSIWKWFDALAWFWKAVIILFVWWLLIPFYVWTKTKLPSAVKWAVAIVFAFSFMAVATTINTPPQEPKQIKSEIERVESPAPKPKPVTKTEETTETIPFEIQHIQDPNLDKGKTVERQAGVNGIKTKYYTVTYTDNIETNRVFKEEVISSAAVANIIADGSKEPPPPPPPPPPPAQKPVAPKPVAPKPAPVPAPVPVPTSQWDPNYSGHVPIASDVDCAGGSGNGPAYVQGPVTVIGTDIYGLDSDHDGIGCE